MSGKKLVAGDIDPVTRQLTPGSMAACIERALADLVKPGANEDLLGRRYLALAIARGVIEHLHDSAAALHVTVPDITGGGYEERPVKVDMDLGSWK